MSTQLPLSKMKKIARFDDDVAMINAEAVFALATATETFVALLAKQVHLHAVSGKRKTLQMRDFDDTLRTVPWLDFLDGALVGWDDMPVDEVDMPVEEEGEKKNVDDGGGEDKMEEEQHSKTTSAAGDARDGEGEEIVIVGQSEEPTVDAAESTDGSDQDLPETMQENDNDSDY